MSVERHSIDTLPQGATYGKLANLGVVNAHDLVFFGGTQAETRDHVDDKEENAASEERVCHSGDGVGKLVS